MYKRQIPRAALPALEDDEPLVLKARTPRIDKIFNTDSNPELKIVLEEIAQDYFSNELATVLATPTGSYDAGASLPKLEKLEFFLEIAQLQRELHLRRKPKRPPTPSSPKTT